MSKQQIAYNDISDDDWRDAFRRAGMAAVGIQGPALCGNLTGLSVTVVALGRCTCIGAYDLAKRRNLLRIGSKLMEGIVKDRYVILSISVDTFFSKSSMSM